MVRRSSGPRCAHLDSLIWQIGHRLKPGVFLQSRRRLHLIKGIPLPGLLLAALVPFWEGARTLSRYALIAAPGICLLVMRGVEQVRQPAIRLLLVGSTSGGGISFCIRKCLSQPTLSSGLRMAT